MKNNIENIPSEVFDWLSSKSFEQLDANQKQLVLQFFSIEEYHELANSMNELKSVIKPVANNSVASKEVLMNKFDEVYSQQTNRFKLPYILRYAAIFIVSLGLGYQLHFWMQPASTNQVVFQPIIDTVYINNDNVPISASSLEDREPFTSEMRIAKNTQTKRKVVTTPVMKMNLNFNVVSIQDAQNKANIPKGNNCKSDSLRRKFGYVSL